MKKEHSILIVDDEFTVRDSLRSWFAKDGFKVGVAENAEKALAILQGEAWDIILLDIKMPGGMDGLELQKVIYKIDPQIIVIIITAFAAVNTAIEALKNGAFDYVTKPFDPEEITHLINNALKQRDLAAENLQLKERVDSLSGHDEIIGKSEQIKSVTDLIDAVAKTDSTVLIRGESGTGKELVARAIHARSSRRYFPIVSMNCGALNENLLESELFGHEKGSFTGAHYARKGKIESADGGTLFLDEIGAVHPKTQIELLRVIETREFCRLGSDKPKTVDFRIICATNHDLEKAIVDKTFREDLFYRINVFSIYLPPLRERKSDIPLLAKHFAGKYAMSMGKEEHQILPETLEILLKYSWPGNIRELENAIERAMVVAAKNSIKPGDLPFKISEQTLHEPIGESMEDVEKNHIRDILKRTDFNVLQASKILGIDRTTLYNKMKKYDLQE